MEMDRPVPSVSLPGMTPEERELAHAIEQNLRSLTHHCIDVMAAIMLFEECRLYVDGASIPGVSEENQAAQRSLRSRWMWLACTATVVAIYNISELLEALGTNTNACLPIRGTLNHGKKREATRTFAHKLPGVTNLRHTTAHFLYGTPEKAAEHRHATGLLLNQNLVENRFVSSYEGKEVSCEMATSTVEALFEVRDLYFEAFAPLSQIQQHQPSNSNEVESTIDHGF